MAGTVFSDALSTNALPDAMRVIFSSQLEFTARPMLVTDQPEFVEIWPEFGAKRGSTVTRTVYHQLPPAFNPLSENTDVVAGGLQDHQVSLSIQEYGDARGTTEALDLLSYHGPISTIIKSLLGPQMALVMDTLARNALWYGQSGQAQPMFKLYSDGTVNSRAALGPTNTLSSAMVKNSAYRLGVRQVPTLGMREPAYICLAHPSLINDLRNDQQWKDSNLYAGSTRIFNGEEGMLHGVRFLKSNRYRIANGGTVKYQHTLAAAAAAGANSVVVDAATGISVGDEITLHVNGDSTTALNQASSSTTWTAPNGKDAQSEEMVVASISGTTITFTNKLNLPHAIGEFFTEAYDVYPAVTMGGLQPLAKGVALSPEVRVSLPTDKLRRMSYVGWYSLLGYGIARPWSYEVNELLGTANVAPVYSF